MEKIRGNMHVFLLLGKFLTCKHKNMFPCIFLHLVLTFTPHYIIMLFTQFPGFDFGLLHLSRSNVVDH